jgi:hypothetical protein
MAIVIIFLGILIVMVCVSIIVTLNTSHDDLSY